MPTRGGDPCALACLFGALLVACGARPVVPVMPERGPTSAETAAILSVAPGPGAEVLAARVVGDHAIAVVFHRGDVALPIARGRVCAGPLPALSGRESQAVHSDRGATALVRVALGETPRLEDVLTLETAAYEGMEVCTLRASDLDGDGVPEVQLVYTRLSNFTPLVRLVVDLRTFAVQLSDETNRWFRFGGATRSWTFLAESGSGTGARLEITGDVPMPEDLVAEEVPTEHETFVFADPIPGTTELHHDASADCWRTADGATFESAHEPERPPRRTSRLEMIDDTYSFCPGVGP